MIRNLASQQVAGSKEGKQANACQIAAEVELQITAMNEEYDLKGLIVKGRHMSMVLWNFSSADKSDISYGLDHLSKLPYCDNRIAEFLLGLPTMSLVEKRSGKTATVFSMRTTKRCWTSCELDEIQLWDICRGRTALACNG